MERENEKGEIERLRERLTILSEACLRINETLDLETVLQDVVDSARILTGARYISTLINAAPIRSEEGEVGVLLESAGQGA